MADLRTLRLARPCCGARLILPVSAGRRVQTYARRCIPCGITWAIRRETIGCGVITDSVEWLDTTSRAYIRRVEVAP